MHNKIFFFCISFIASNKTQSYILDNGNGHNHNYAKHVFQNVLSYEAIGIRGSNEDIIM